MFNSFRGIIAYFKVENGVIRKGDKVKVRGVWAEIDGKEVSMKELVDNYNAKKNMEDEDK